MPFFSSPSRRNVTTVRADDGCEIKSLRFCLGATFPFACSQIVGGITRRLKTQGAEGFRGFRGLCAAASADIAAMYDTSRYEHVRYDSNNSPHSYAAGYRERACVIRYYAVVRRETTFADRDRRLTPSVEKRCALACALFYGVKVRKKKKRKKNIDALKRSRCRVFTTRDAHAPTVLTARFSRHSFFRIVALRCIALHCVASARDNYLHTVNKIAAELVG